MIIFRCRWRIFISFLFLAFEDIPIFFLDFLAGLYDIIITKDMDTFFIMILIFRPQYSCTYVVHVILLIHTLIIVIQVRRAWWTVHRGWLPTCRMWRSFSGKELIFGFPPIRDKPKQTQSKSAHCRVSCRMFCSLVVGISVVSIIEEEP